MADATSPAKKLHDGSMYGLPAAQVYEQSKFGMWLFLATEILLFAMLFTGYAVYYFKYPKMFHDSAKALNVIFGTINTIVLLASSFTVAWAIDAIKRGKTRLMNILLVITIILGAAFLVNKYFEYSHEIHVGNLKLENFGTVGRSVAESAVPSMFFFLYFVMTGIHGLHIVIGLALLIWVLIKGLKGQFHPGWYTPVEISGLYWHLVDLIWIYLFPLLYLVS